MADAYGDNDLRRLEREAEAARARLHGTIAEIKDPQTMENAKLEMKDRAMEMKDQIVDYITGARDKAIESGRSQSNEFSRKLQRTAIENPLSVALIGAGIGWHLYKKPPVTTVLIGAGLYQLFKNWDRTDDRAYRDPYDPVSPRGYVPGGVAGYGYDEVTDIASATQRVRTVATNLAYGAESAVSGVQEAIAGAKDRVRETVSGAMGEGASSAMSRAQPADEMTALAANMADRAGEQYQKAATRMQDMAESATDNVRGMAQDAQRRVGDMVGGVADEAQRRMRPVIDRVSPYLDSEHRGQLGLALVLGGVGVLAGGLLRNSETGRRLMDQARDRVGDSWESMRDMSRDLPRRAPVDEWRDRASETMSRMGDQATSSVSRLSEQAGEWGRSAADSAGRMRERSADYMRSAQDMGSEHPLLLSAIGLAIGAVLGGMIRQTPFERESFGPMAGRLRDEAVDTLQENMENIADRASRVAGAVVESVTGGSDDPAKKAQAQRDRVNA